MTIEQLPYADVIGRYDAPSALLCLDPPYDETERQSVAFGRNGFNQRAPSC